MSNSFSYDIFNDFSVAVLWKTCQFHHPLTVEIFLVS